ncbi:hypothetical protein AAG570_012019 [Ranatra chinensis]|uniref:Ran GTPase-activating protein 1 n=1 Tax=Ranatra chinensis TaxID=642074 RepID=A0ABD0Z3V9_9HEMI
MYIVSALAKEVVDEINKCESLEFLNLEGNSLGVVAAEEISKALMTRSEFKRAIWKDMFTGRLKTEIPKALKFLGRALITANARLVVLDLSDNASGPIGVEGFKELLTSPTCYTLKELKLNNMGLGITGGKMLASALMECYNKSKEDGTPLCLRVFIAGRNRLENEGATALAAVFKALKSLEVVSIPQNGIYSAGVKALSSAFAENKNLRQIDLNDNTVSPKGAKDLAAILGELKSLNTLDLGDCLLKSEGVTCMADKLSTLPNLEVLNLSYNEIGAEAGLELVKGLANNSSLKKINLNGNQFGMQGCDSIKETMNSYGKTQILDSLR